MKDSSEELQKVSDFYGSDFDKGQLEAQLLVFKSKFKELKKEKVVLKDIIDFMSKPGHFAILSEISTVGSYLFLFKRACHYIFSVLWYTFFTTPFFC